jgi:hypothetical protein
MLYRSFAAENKRYSILHASAAITRYGDCVIFGDDGCNSIGKTLLSLVTASNSDMFISDEYTLMDNLTENIYGNGDIPINLKKGTSELIKNLYNIQLKDKSLIFANDYFKIKSKVRPDIIIIPYVNSAYNEIVIPCNKEKASIIKSMVNGHNIKYLDERFDHFSILNSSKKQNKDIRKELKKYKRINWKIPIVKLYIKNVYEVNKQLEMIYKNINNFTK